ncbi:MAG: hypothetical protein HHJ16_14790 [Polaromonas sp.]|uniref:hypothetical protein n=1 Tax=Polaromonas sp. TaxID=1869339 RepID=UPI001826AC4C|nr:hypothetical protein [Polaromonas sp.]NMM11524.1 hypothetical protein [Polaromonas sp.]
MNMKFRKIWLAVAGTTVLALAGCGGGSSGSSLLIPSADVISGVAATGAALANAGVAVTNSSGNSPCLEASISTTALGSYTCTLKNGETAPFFVVVTDPTGNTPPMVSVTTTTPTHGTPLTLNVTPLTTAIVAQLASDGNPLTLVNSKQVNAADLKQLTANVVAQLLQVLKAIQAPDGYDPFTTSITAATASGIGNTADMVLDVVKVVTNPATGKLALSTVDNPLPIDLATATAPGTPMPLPDAAIATLSQAAQVAAQTLTACFAIPTAQRVVTKDATIVSANGGPEVTNVDPACQNITATLGNGAGVKFLDNGYKAGQVFYNLLTSDTMTGAKFSVPEIMAYYPADPAVAAPAPAAFNRAVINIKFLDANGDPGHVITTARKIPGTTSTSRPTDWWLVGNQHPADVNVKLQIRRVEQKNPANTAKFSTFQTGIQFNVNSTGPGSSNAGNALKYARISGPGLPGNGAAGTGLVYVVSTGTQTSMDLFSKTGSLTTGSQCGNVATFNCPNFWLARTTGLDPASSAKTLAANPANSGNVLLWKQPADSTVDSTKFVKGAKYQVELFYGTTPTTAAIIFHKTLLSDLVQAEQAVNLPWNTLGAQSVSALDPTGSLTGAQTALPIDWVQNSSAQQIHQVQAVVDTTFGSFGPLKAVPRGATSAILDNQTVPIFGIAPNIGRTLLFSYRMLDGSGKTAVYTYN